MNTSTPASTTDSALAEQNIRERAHARWLELGCPTGDDHAHWYWARQQLHEQAQRPAHDKRLDVVAGEARQRVRGRHVDRSLRAPLKKPQ